MSDQPIPENGDDIGPCAICGKAALPKFGHFLCTEHGDHKYAKIASEDMGETVSKSQLRQLAQEWRTAQEKTNDTVELTIYELKELETDSRGRVYLGSDYKDSTVKVAILDVEANE